MVGSRVVQRQNCETKTRNWQDFKKYWRNSSSTGKERRNIKRVKKSIIKMEQHKISKFLNDSTVSKFVTKEWIEVNDLSSDQYSVNKKKRFKTSMLRSDSCDYSDAYIVVKGKISVTDTDNANRRNEKLVSKNNVPFRSSISKINNALVDKQKILILLCPCMI